MLGVTEEEVEEEEVGEEEGGRRRGRSLVARKEQRKMD